MKRMICALMVFTFVFSFCVSLAEAVYPSGSGRNTTHQNPAGIHMYCEDRAGVLPDEIIEEINNREEECAVDMTISIVTVSTTGETEIDSYTQSLFNKLFNKGKIGEFGVLLVMAVDDEDYYAFYTYYDTLFSPNILTAIFNEGLEDCFAEGVYGDAAINFCNACTNRILEYFDECNMHETSEEDYYEFRNVPEEEYDEGTQEEVIEEKAVEENPAVYEDVPSVDYEAFCGTSVSSLEELPSLLGWGCDSIFDVTFTDPVNNDSKFWFVQRPDGTLVMRQLLIGRDWTFDSIVDMPEFVFQDLGYGIGISLEACNGDLMADGSFYFHGTTFNAYGTAGFYYPEWYLERMQSEVSASISDSAPIYDMVKYAEIGGYIYCIGNNGHAAGSYSGLYRMDMNREHNVLLCSKADSFAYADGVFYLSKGKVTLDGTYTAYFDGDDFHGKLIGITNEYLVFKEYGTIFRTDYNCGDYTELISQILPDSICCSYGDQDLLRIIGYSKDGNYVCCQLSYGYEGDINEYCCFALIDIQTGDYSFPTIENHTYAADYHDIICSSVWAQAMDGYVLYIPGYDIEEVWSYHIADGATAKVLTSEDIDISGEKGIGLCTLKNGVIYHFYPQDNTMLLCSAADGSYSSLYLKTLDYNTPYWKSIAACDYLQCGENDLILGYFEETNTLIDDCYTYYEKLELPEDLRIKAPEDKPSVDFKNQIERNILAMDSNVASTVSVNAGDTVTPERPESKIAEGQTETVLDDLPVQITNPDTELPSLAEEDMVHVTNLGMQEGLPEEWLNVLLLGTDERTLGAYACTDCMMICSINRNNGEVKLTSIMPDTAFVIDNEGSKYDGQTFRINAANCFGSPMYTMKVINEKLNMNIQYYVMVNFYGFSKIASALGGIDMDITEAEKDEINYFAINQAYNAYYAGVDESDLEAAGENVRLETFGKNTHLNGRQTLAYARICHLDSEASRTERQRKVLVALLNKVKDKGVGAITMLPALFRNVTTNLDINTIAKIATTVLESSMENVESLRIPINGSYDQTTKNNQSMLWDTDWNANANELYNFIYSWACENCGRENGEEDNFCPFCSFARPGLEWTCAGCGRINAAEDNFCPICATPRGADLQS